MKNKSITFTTKGNNGESISGFYSRDKDKIVLMLPNSGKLYEMHIVGASQSCPHRIYLLDGDEVTVNFNEDSVPATWNILTDVGHDLYQNVIGMENRGARSNRTPDTVFMDLARAFRKDLSTLVARVENVKLARPEWEFLTEVLSENKEKCIDCPTLSGRSLAVPAKEHETDVIWLYRLTDEFPRKYYMGDCGFILQIHVTYDDKLIALKEAMKTALLGMSTAMFICKNS